PHCPPTRPWLLSKSSSTAARPTGARSPAPLKMTSCIDSPRSADALDSPRTQRTASMTFDLPQPLGPTMPTSCPGVAMVTGSTNDLKPASLISVRRNSGSSGNGLLWEPKRADVRVAAASKTRPEINRGANAPAQAAIIAYPRLSTGAANQYILLVILIQRRHETGL